jgi:L-asparaginase
MIGLEVEDGADDASTLRRGKVVFDFNCGGMFRAWIEEGFDGMERERVMVFREEYA